MTLNENHACRCQKLSTFTLRCGTSVFLIHIRGILNGLTLTACHHEVIRIDPDCFAVQTSVLCFGQQFKNVLAASGSGVVAVPRRFSSNSILLAFEQFLEHVIEDKLRTGPPLTLRW